MRLLYSRDRQPPPQLFAPQETARPRAGLLTLVLLVTLFAPTFAPAQQVRDFTEAPEAFPNIFKPYQRQELPAPRFDDVHALAPQAQDGEFNLSLQGLLRAVAGNNLDIARARYNYFIAETDVLRTRSGEAPRGTSGALVPGGLGGSIGGSANFFTGLATSARAVNVGARGSLDPTLALSFSLDTQTTPQTTTVLAGATEVTSHAAVMSLRYAQAFTTGTSFSVGFNTQRQSSTSRNQLFNPSFASNYSLAFTQQLLSGFGRDVNRRFIRVADNNRAVAREVFRQQALTTLSQAKNLYWDLVAAQERIRTAEQALAVSDQLVQENRRRVEIGVLAPLDVLASEAEAAARRRDLIVAQTNEQVVELRLKNMMSRQMDPRIIDGAVHPVDALPAPREADVPALEDAVAAAIQNRPELQQVEGGIRNQQVAVEFSRKRLQPALSIFGLLSSSGRRGDLWPAWSQVARVDFPEYAYGFSLTFSLGNRAAQADNLTARLNLRQAETALQRTQSQIRLEVRNAITGLVQARAQVAAAERTAMSTERTLDAEQRKLRAGTSTSYNVIRVQRDLYAAQLAEVQARVSYAKAQVELERATGTALDVSGLTVEALLQNGSDFAAPPTQ